MERADALWTRLHEPVRAFVARRAPPGIDADDVVQDVFLAIHTKLDRLRAHDRVDAWIFQIARNALVEAIRRRQRERAKIDKSALAEPEIEVAPEDEGEGRAIAACLRAMVRDLPEHHRVALELTELGGMTQIAAAAELGITQAAMKARCRRARADLAERVHHCCAIVLDRRGHVIEHRCRGGSCSCASAAQRAG